MGRVMAEPPNLMLQARELLATPSHERLESLVIHLSTRQETTEYQTAIALLKFCIVNFANCLTLKLLQMYRSSSDALLRSKSIVVLSQTLAAYKARRFELSLVALNEIKPLVISCLRMQETEIKLFRRIVSFIAHDVVMLDNGGWDELSDCIVQLSSTVPLKALHVFVDLPPVYGRFIYSCFGKIAERAEKVLLMPDQDRVEDWSLGLQAVVKLGIQVLDSELRFDMVKGLLTLLVKAASDLVDKGMEEFLVRGLADLEMFLSRDKKLYSYNKEQCHFVSCFLYKIKDLGPLTKQATGKIHRLQQQQQQGHGACSEGEWLDRLNNLKPLEMLRIFASTDVEERFRELAIRRLNVLLSDRVSREKSADMKELQPLLLSCLSSKEGISESMFKVLGEVVYHVAFEMTNFHFETWYDLSDCIASTSETEFERAVYIFQCLTMWLDDEFMVPIEIADKMVDSVRELVERKMEVGLVRRAFRDLESIVKKQKDWFGDNEYELIKALLQRLYVIKGMTMESKMVLWRINVFVERGLADLAEVEPDGEID
ncbi:BnaC04g56010D [Brassica napus]|uniref:BnaC04g56010D protein n=1 Tax=Brassica napus TaxID=3708 RepID=A0A078JF80_BRANA|nr:BnaC04g56010D [Brassica napus]